MIICPGCHNESDSWNPNEPLCTDCLDAVDKWEAESMEREQRAREKLDIEGYYDA